MQDISDWDEKDIKTFTVLLNQKEIEHLDVVMRTKVGRILDMRTQEGEIINKILMQVYNKVGKRLPYEDEDVSR